MPTPVPTGMLLASVLRIVFCPLQLLARTVRIVFCPLQLLARTDVCVNEHVECC
jgi:hypothetical protein